MLMQPLRNTRHEAFAQAVAAGMSATAAYRLVYQRAENADVMGPRLLGNVGIRARVAELQAQTASETVLNMRERREAIAQRVRGGVAKDSDLVSLVMADAKLAGELKGDAPIASVKVNIGLGEEERAELMAAKQRAIDEREEEMALEKMAARN